MPFCSRCGRDLAKDAIFCPTCGASIAAPIPPPPVITAEKESKTGRNIIIAVGLIFLLLIVGGLGYGIYEASKPPPGTPTPTPPLTTPTPTLTPTPAPTPTATVELKHGSTVRLGETFIWKETSGGVPIKVTFTRAWFATKYSWETADEGYKFLVLEVQFQNAGIEETDVPLRYWWKVIVDKGYIYEGSECDLPSGTVRPEEIKTGHILFEILATTSPVEARYYEFYGGEQPDLTVDLRGESIAMKTAPLSEAQLEILLGPIEFLSGGDIGWQREQLNSS